METKKRSSRKGAKPKVENYYKILNTRSNATQQTIKAKYIAQVKAFPPETHPEEFQRIRRAYETLRDPVKRREYDMLRKYGGKIEKLMEKAFEFMGEEKWDKAEELFRQALQIAPEDAQVHLGLAYTTFWQGDERTFEEEFQRAVELAPVAEDKVMLFTIKAGLLLDDERPEEALQVLQTVEQQYPQHRQLFHQLSVRVYIELGREDELWAMTRAMLPAPGAENPEDIYLFIHWFNTMIDLEKWQEWSKVQQRLRRFLKSLDGAGKSMVLEAIQNEHDNFYEGGFFRGAEMLVDLMYYLDGKNPQVQERRRQTREMACLEKELLRIRDDQSMFPLISVYAFEWFYEDYLPPEELFLLRESIPPMLLEAIEGMDHEFAAGMVKLRKKYPLIYKRFQDRWDDLGA
ncbi:heat shock protein DnaJ domain protein [Desulforamulus reducens MI-1]|uniref:Heat shock protein DnaJ domain protein n=1 Tax=Desulforamulus reducens (strain ATCC BAA-1160 / DSM 100696 / MI-1) TaxID=349161 RepID=A4J963_DESRM|nr:DnaJ domain-containing protein [Desulforamulus reducens]ABO51616.1 heat shock protein DnaJ domain protein [Desulforamulus reducens MI-1]